MKLLLDHHYPNAIARELRRRSHDVETALERNLESVDDETLLTEAASQRRAVLTNNLRDYVPILRRWAALEQPHAGVIFTSYLSLPRDASSVGSYVTRLDALLAANPADDAFANRVHWL